jgi:hypothetical protein
MYMWKMGYSAVVLGLIAANIKDPTPHVTNPMQTVFNLFPLYFYLKLSFPHGS